MSLSKELNVWVDFNQFPFFSFSLVSDPAIPHPHRSLLRVRGQLRERPERQQISHEPNLSIFLQSESFRFRFDQILV